MPELSGLDGAMDKRRQARGLTWRQVAEQAGISYETLRAIRKGEQAGSDLTRRGLERALLWETGGFEIAEAGGDPAVVADAPAVAAAEAPSEPPSDPQVEAILTILDGLPASVQAEVFQRLGKRLPPGVQHGRKAS
ncbi:multiprotein-bridging factor 1 family protein [Streptomyces sp. NPDC056254]|uniref:helix-turn-helix domain-containing protein n=1 Tax=Streptomyces sp. NPDC056254 TaxID=3345763 RepID=UPI0035D7D03E